MRPIGKQGHVTRIKSIVSFFLCQYCLVECSKAIHVSFTGRDVFLWCSSYVW